MDLFFHSGHLRTLCKLKELADKHNCKINFGTKNSNSADFDRDILSMCKVNKKIISQLDNYLEHNISIKEPNTDIGEVWFELYDKNTDKYNTMSFGEFRCSFCLEKDFCFEEDKEKLLTEFMENECYEGICRDGNPFILFRTAPTTIYGFKYKSKHTDFRVYRPDMALKYFGDLVCDYLHEPRIEEAY